MSTDTTQRDLGRIDAELINLRHEVNEMRGDVRAIRTALAEAKGGVRVLIGAGAGIGGVMGSVAHWLLSK